MATADDCAWLLRFKVLKGNLVKQRADAIVNAANESLLGGGGVDGAIHDAAGPGLLAECRTLGGCATGSAKITGGHKLPAKHIIHTVGPVWRGGSHAEDELLRRCYESVFALMEEHGLKTVAFPAISCGAYGFPLERAARIAVAASKAFLERSPEVEWVRVVCFEVEVYEAYLDVLQDHVPE